MAEAERLALADVVDVGQLGDVHHVGEVLVLALVAQEVLELEVAVEVVLDDRLLPA